ncbi:N-acetyl-gamma-glutamyl-phosphate reductase [Corynebacterium cystitidis]|uniref:N-acetyl-gamma-glutamyl-phosphate reductase n=1 Tax=Corynebacterium cystitidis DSM 20524 TaxID=1121357 RepID=A0A1H9V9X4_9CORY|nr:N-acetyl-gamma-glutamyl-phosphate reductase [Corynebacterium cystitidis]WJY82330.1 N-acetyl-gamma-glutamyl-phosphate reductase [Corynebacterium cystitidis DSM 20524]SES18630.1 N-acetyl-gamma-glutamyl-phosphate reductase [Corynebacterium cystitidis DSM 20524]SNV76437.1 N-acetyl-gamma-glutamyl-phosphate reductase [Corynebacterium cystitidis]
MTLKVAVAGATGYAGGEILRLLLQHPQFLAGKLEIGALTGNSNAGQKVTDLMPHLPQLADRVIDSTTIEVLDGHDVVFLGLPHGFSAEIGAALSDDTLVIDCAADFRLKNADDWEAYYGSEHAGSWTYGIPEMPGHREQIASDKRIAVPGCFPTGATLAILPAVKAGIAEPDISIVSITGVSGAGKKSSVAMLGSETMGSLKAYNTAGRHRHTPEVAQNIAEVTDKDVTISFTPVLAPLPRGILTTATLPLVGDVTEDMARQVYEGFYSAEPFVHVLSAGAQPQTQNVVGSNMCHVQVEVDIKARRLLVTSAIDNLTKGTAGAAVQCMNIALGFDETAGLPQAGVAP